MVVILSTFGASHDGSLDGVALRDGLHVLYGPHGPHGPRRVAVHARR